MFPGSKWIFQDNTDTSKLERLHIDLCFQFDDHFSKFIMFPSAVSKWTITV